MITSVAEEPLFREVFAFVDSQLPLRFNAAPLARVLTLYQWGKLKKGHLEQSVLKFSSRFSYLVIILLNTGTAIAIMTTPNTISTVS